jgi:hypothetical protein
VPALDGTFALVQMHDVAAAVAEHLHLDVARGLDVALDIDRCLAECRLGAAAGGGERRGQFSRRVHTDHADTATAGGRLEKHRKPDLPRCAFGLGDVGHGAGAAGKDGDARRRHQPPRLGLVPHPANRLRAGTDEHDPRRHTRLGKAPVLGQKTVPGMDGVCPCASGGVDDARDIEVTFARGGRADGDRRVGVTDVGGVTIRFGVNGDGLHPEPTAGPEHAARNLPTVGHEDGAEH